MAKQTDITYTTPFQPRQIRLDTVGNKCNAGCLSCHRFLTERNGFMAHTLLTTILDDVARWETPLTEIVPVNYGEFFLHPDWFWILQQIRTKLPRTQIVLPTNGSLLTEGALVQLSEITNLRIINFSVNAYFDKTYEQFMKLPASIITRIKTCIRQLKVLRPDITVWVSMVFDPIYQTDLERDKFIEFWKPLAFPQVIPAASACRVEKKVSEPVKLPCRSLFSDIVVGYDGKISSCCFDANFTLDLGKYKKNLLASWRNPKLEKIRELHNTHRRDSIPLCRGCTFA